jgi:hypothetical protein
MRLARESDPLPRLLACAYAGLAALGWLAMRLRPDAILGAARCPLRAATGIPCPTCGGTHAAAALARLDVAGALRWNPLVTVGALALAVWGAAAIVATCAPRLRWRLVLAPAEALALRVGTGIFVIATWAYLAWRFA